MSRPVLSVLLLAAIGSGAWAQGAHPILDTMPGHHHIIVRPELIDTLGLLADTATIEHTRCLVGKAIATNGADTLYAVDLIFAPRVAKQDALKVSGVARCPVATVSTWHNHILRVVKGWGRGPWFTTDTTGRAACFAAAQDVFSGSGPNVAPLMTVQVNSKTFCWWTRDQLRAIRAAGALPIVLWPRADQLRTDWGAEEIERPRTGERAT